MYTLFLPVLPIKISPFSILTLSNLKWPWTDIRYDKDPHSQLRTKFDS